MILAIDPGTKNIGYAIFDKDYLVSYGVCEKENTTFGKLGIVKMIDTFFNIISKYDISVIIFEDYAESPNLFNKEESEIMGIFYSFIYFNYDNMPIGLFPISTIKKYITGNGRAKKSEVIKAVKKYLFRINIENAGVVSHSADAIAIGLLYLSFKKNNLSKDLQEMLQSRIFKISRV